MPVSSTQHARRASMPRVVMSTDVEPPPNIEELRHIGLHCVAQAALLRAVGSQALRVGGASCPSAGR